MSRSRKVADLVHGIAAIAEENETTIATIGHAGDGNFHPLVVFDRDDPAAVKKAENAFGRVMDLALSLGGVVTGEHGIGTLKLPWVVAQLGNDVVELSEADKGRTRPARNPESGKGSVIQPRDPRPPV